uniref:UspA domain-containing protein n=1 Tax=Aegilops tauschii subsp. strangulata TaxID=200361 RepID=A0A453FPI9_AEGTS
WRPTPPPRWPAATRRPRRCRRCGSRRGRRRRSSPPPRATSSPRSPARTPPPTAASPSPSTSPTSPPSPCGGPCRTTCGPATPSCSSTCAPPPSSTVPTGAAAAEGSEPHAASSAEELQKKREEDFDAFTSTKSQDLAQPLVAAQIPFKIHVVKDHDMKERLCLEAERLGLSAMIMGSRGFGASRKGGKGRLGSVSDYCVHHCVCPVVVVRYPDDAAGIPGEAAAATDELHTVPEDEPVYHDAPDGMQQN